MDGTAPRYFHEVLVRVSIMSLGKQRAGADLVAVARGSLDVGEEVGQGHRGIMPLEVTSGGRGDATCVPLIPDGGSAVCLACFAHEIPHEIAE